MDRIVLVTGATSGFGRAIAESFAAAGDHVILTGRRKDRLASLADTLSKNHGIRTLPLSFDVRDRGEVMRGIGEMRVKESDRIALTAAGLAACGVGVEEEPEGLIVSGTSRANHAVAGGARVTTHGDHRIAMSHLVLGLAAEAPVSVDEPGMIATSFPGFTQMMTGLGAQIEAAELDAA